MVFLAKRVELRFEKPDIYAGLSGILKVLCRFDELFSLEGVPEFCASLADRLMSEARIPYKGRYLWRTLSAEWPISGAGHGQSGVASALYLAGQRLERKDLVDAAMAGFEFEADIYSEKLGAWPDRRLAERTDHYITGYCSGAPGIGLNALSLKYNGFSPILEKAIASVRKEPMQFKDILCCGNSAMIEFLLEAGTKLSRPDLTEEARTRMALVLERAKRQGLFNCVNASVSNIYSPSLFYGTAGIGYEMLRLFSPEGTESVLL
jgi:lantibiotic modifying enzyme